MAPTTPQQRRRKPNNWFTKLTDWKIEDLFKRKRPPPVQRTIYVNENLPEDAYEKGKVKTSWVYPTNQVVTSKYTVITFLPKNLLEQFRRIAN
ncbi:hypothetical protein FRC05_007667, partial [Tulasnella sp. 425]